MSLKIGNELVGTLKIGNELVSVAKIGNEIIYRRAPFEPQFGLYVHDRNPASYYVLDRTTGNGSQPFFPDIGQFAGAEDNDIQGMTWDGTDFWVVGWENGAIYKRTTSTGVWTQLGGTFFGIDERQPTGLTWDGTNLYMVGNTQKYLSTIDRTTGAATRVGSANRFDDGVANPQCLTWDGTDLWMSDNNRYIYKVDKSDGTATTISRAPSSLGSPEGLAWDGTNLWAVITASKSLARLDRSDGTFTVVGSSKVGLSVPTGLTWAPVPLTRPPSGRQFTMYGVTTSGRISRLNLEENISEEVTSIGVGTRYGLAWDGSLFYTLRTGFDPDDGTRLEALYSKDINGSGRRVSVGLGFGVGRTNDRETAPRGLTFNSGSLYMIGQSKRDLYVMETTVGNVSPVDGSIATSSTNVSPTALCWANDTLYMVGTLNSQAALYTMDFDGDVGGGSATQVGSATNFGLGITSPTALGWDGENLYMSTGAFAYTLDRTTGIATRISGSGGWVGLVYAEGVKPLPPPPPEVTFDTETLAFTSRGTAKYTMVLNRDPDGSVTITPTSSLTTSATVSGAVTFTSDNWSVPQEVTVTAIEEGSVTISHAVTASTSDIYPTTFTVDSVGVSIELPDQVLLSGETSVSLGLPRNATSTYTLRLNTAPTGSVTVAVANSDSSLVTASPTSITFSTTNWNIPRTVTLSVAGDSSGSATITHSITGGASNYPTSLSIPSISVTVLPPVFSLYMVTSNRGIVNRNYGLYTLDRNTGIADRVGRIDSRQSNAGPVALAWDGTDLWTLDGFNFATLRRLDRSNARWTSVGSTGIGNNPVRALAWDGTNLYCAAIVTDALYTINRTTGAATRVGSDSATFGSGVNNPNGMAWDGTTLWMVDEGNVALHSVDRSTGAATRVGSAVEFGVSVSEPSGLAWDGTTLYMVSYDTDALYTLDRTTGIATQVGSAVEFGIPDTSSFETRKADGLAWAPIV